MNYGSRSFARDKGHSCIRSTLPLCRIRAKRFLWRTVLRTPAILILGFIRTSVLAGKEFPTSPSTEDSQSETTSRRAAAKGQHLSSFGQFWESHRKSQSQIRRRL